MLEPVVARRRGVRGEHRTGEGARLVVVMEKLKRCALDLETEAVEEEEEVEGEEGCADCGGVNVNVGVWRVRPGWAVIGVWVREEVVGVSG